MNNKKKPLILVVSVILINKDNKVLLQERPKNKKFSGYWEFPGGKVELNESPETAILREINEELNIILDKKDLVNFTFISYEYEDFYLLMPVFKCKKWVGTIKANDKQKFKFCSKNDLKKLNIIEADFSIINALEKILK